MGRIDSARGNAPPQCRDERKRAPEVRKQGICRTGMADMRPARISGTDDPPVRFDEEWEGLTCSVHARPGEPRPQYCDDGQMRSFRDMSDMTGGILLLMRSVMIQSLLIALSISCILYGGVLTASGWNWWATDCYCASLPMRRGGLKASLAWSLHSTRSAVRTLGTRIDLV